MSLPWISAIAFKFNALNNRQHDPELCQALGQSLYWRHSVLRHRWCFLFDRMSEGGTFFTKKKKSPKKFCLSEPELPTTVLEFMAGHALDRTSLKYHRICETFVPSFKSFVAPAMPPSTSFCGLQRATRSWKPWSWTIPLLLHHCLYQAHLNLLPQRFLQLAYKKAGTLHHKPTCLLFHRLKIAPKRAITCRGATVLYALFFADWNCHTTRFEAIVLNFDICILFILDAMHHFHWWRLRGFHSLHSNGIPDWTTIAQTLFTSRLLLFYWSPHRCLLLLILLGQFKHQSWIMCDRGKSTRPWHLAHMSGYSTAHERPCHTGLPWTPRSSFQVHSNYSTTNLRSLHPIWRNNAIATKVSKSYSPDKKGTIAGPSSVTTLGAYGAILPMLLLSMILLGIYVILIRMEYWSIGSGVLNRCHDSLF